MPDRPFDDEFLRRIELLRLAVRRLGTVPREGERAARRLGSSLEPVKVREYAPGDDLRQVDWAAYARFEQFLVRQFAREEAVSLELVLDASASMRMGAPPTKLDRARQLAAALGYLALHDRGQARLHWPAAEGLLSKTFPGRAQSADLIRALGAEPPAGPPLDLERAVNQLAASVGHRPFLVLFSDFWVEGVLGPLRRAAARFGRAAAIHLLSPEEVEPTLSGKARLVDCESGEAKELYLDEETVADYRRGLQEHRARVEAACREAEVSYVFLRTDLPLEKAFFRTVQEAGVAG